MAPNNLFPCDVTMPDGTVHRTCRVMVTPKATTVWAWSKAARSGVALIVTENRPVETAANSRAYTLTAAGPDGEEQVVTFTHERRCGCSAPMKHWQPPGANRVSA